MAFKKIVECASCGNIKEYIVENDSDEIIAIKTDACFDCRLRINFHKNNRNCNANSQ